MASNVLVYCPDAAVVVKFKIREGSVISSGTILCEYRLLNTKKLCKLKSNCNGTVKELLVKEGDETEKGGPVVSIELCRHLTVWRNMCAECGLDLREQQGLSASVAMEHMIPDLLISEKRAETLGREDELRLLRNRQLVLLVDLDQTLIHTTNDAIPPNLKDVYHFQLWPHPAWYHTKFRPHTEEFLKNISRLYELHICTFGTRTYAHTIARFLDPDGHYFSQRILSRDECFHPTLKTSNLKALFPCGDAMVCIIDDREDVWKMAPNLVHVRPYRFFDGTADINAPPEASKAGDATSGDEMMAGPLVKTTRRNAKIVRVPKVKNRVKKSDANESPICDKNGKQPNSSENVSEINTPEIGSENGRQDEKAKADVDATSCENTVGSDDKKETLASSDLSTQPDVSQETESLPVKEDIDSSATAVVALPEVALPKNIFVERGSEDIKSSPAVADTETTRNNVDAVDVGGENSESVNDLKKQQVVDVGNENGESVNNPNKQQIAGELDSSRAQTMTSGSEIEASTEEEDSQEYEEMVEWEDLDDYLIYLEDVLRRIHTAYYKVYDQMQESVEAVRTTPDLKTIVPYVRRKVLKGARIVLSGVCPLGTDPAASRIHRVAESLGAVVQNTVVFPEKYLETEPTTHVVAARLGTQKVKLAARQKGIKLVNPDWLWTCADRWEWVDERLFPLNDETSARFLARDSPEPGTGCRRKDTSPDLEKLDSAVTPMRNDLLGVVGNPFCSLTSEDLSGMDAEVEKFMDEESDSDEESEGGETGGLPFESAKELVSRQRSTNSMLSTEDLDEEDLRLREQVLESFRRNKRKCEESSDEESLSGEFPKGWRKSQPKRLKQECNGDQEEGDEIDDEENAQVQDAGDDTSSSSKSTSDNRDEDDFDDSVGSADDEMAAAVEREFLS